MPLRPLVLARSFTRTTAGLSLHPAGREVSSIRAGLRVVALGVSLLAAETVLLVLLLALVVESLAIGTTTATIGLRVFSSSSDVEKVFLIRSCDVGSLALCKFVSFL
jgi:hypothetical protein